MHSISPSASGANLDGAADFLTSWADGRLLAVARINPDTGANGETFELPAQRSALNAWLEAYSGKENLYFSLNEPKPVGERSGKNGRLTESDIATIRAIGVDIDPKADVESTEGGYDRERARLLALASEQAEHFLAPPSVIIDSGNGIQMIWRTDQPLPNDETTRATVKAHAKAIELELGSDAVRDVARLYRIPFTENLPNAKKLAKGRGRTTATLLHCDSRARYSLQTLGPLAAPISEPDPAPTTPASVGGVDYAAVREVIGRPQDLPPHLAARVETLRAEWPRLGELLETDDDRSGRDYAIAARLHEDGLTDPTELAQATFALSPEKLEEKDGQGYGASYASNTISRALARTKPRPTDSDWFDGSASTGAPPANLPAPLPMFDVIRGPIDPTTVPTREYVISPRLPVGDVSQLIGAPGTGKSTFILRDAVAVVTGRDDILSGVDSFGRPIAAERIHRPGSVLVINGEDSKGDMRRRLLALYAHHGVTADHHPLVLWSGVNDVPLKVMERKGDRSPLLPADGLKLLEDTIGTYNIVLVAIDPQISIARGALENSNEDADLIMSELARLATRAGVSIALAHHTGKATRASAGDLNAGRGASAFGGKARFVSTLVKVTKEDAEEWGLPYTNDLIRLDNAKASHDKQPDGPTFFRRLSVPVGNGTGATADEAFAGNAREQLRARGEEAPVLEIVDHRALRAAAADGGGAMKDKVKAEAIARIADELLGDVDRITLSALWEVMGERMLSAKLTTATKRNSIASGIVNALGGAGVVIERSGRAARIKAAKTHTNTTAPWWIERTVVAPATEAP